MSSKRLKQIEELYHAALALPPADREAFIKKSCGNDEDLSREIESLLAVERSAKNFFEQPPLSLAAEMFAQRENKANLSGHQISHYKIIRLLGAGGMGEVYLAEDLKLHRQIALKVLTSQFESDVERIKRFKKEARAVSALNHPNIITIYSIEETEAGSFIATEFIEGKTLRERIAERPLSWQEAVKIAIQMTGALKTAHSVGIVHRDIKPANVMIRRDGIVKVLDFGLAKLTGPDSDDLDTREHTAPNRLMGTINYMSPEQVLGEPVDARTDIFSFGVVLYEMLSGEMPFAGPSDAAIYNATINKVLPSLRESNDAIPPALDQIVKCSMEKDPALRYQSFSELRADLKSILRESQTGSFDNAATKINMRPIKTKDLSVAKSPRSTVWLIASLLILGLVVGAYWKYFSTQSPVAKHFQSIKLDVLTASGLARSVAISPDGKYIAYSKDEDGKYSLWLRQTASAGDTQIVPPGPTKYDFLRFSHDGNFLFFVGTESADQPSSLYQITTLGRNQRKLITGVDSQISFSPDGTNLAFIRTSEADNSIIIAGQDGGNERVLVTRKYPKVYGDEVSWSPDGKMIAVPTLTRGATYAGGMAVVDVATGNETPIPLKEEKLLRISQIAWMNDGKGLIYTPYAADMGQRYQIRYAAYPSGEVQNVTNDLSSYEDFSLTADSQTMVAIQREYSMGIWLTVEDDFSSTVSINSKTAADDGERGITWTRDGKIVFVSSEGGAQNIWRMDADGSNPKPLTTDYLVGKVLPTLAIDGDSITFLDRAFDKESKKLLPGSNFYQMDSDGQNVRRVVEDPNCAFAAASANKDWVVYTSRADGKFRILKVSIQGGNAVTLTDVDSISPVISRDGKLVAYFVRQKGKPLQLGIISIDGGTPLKTIQLPATTNSGAGLAWNKSGNGILFVNTLGTTSNIWTQPLDGAKPTPLTAFKEFQIAAFALNPQGNRLAIARGSRNRDVVLIKNLAK
ncbi:MAG TPA: protein kinase [Pyrinomonadaceae bacterium]|nr:protein kinase [Pyrinomonadaceae bacterium]